MIQYLYLGRVGYDDGLRLQSEIAGLVAEGRLKNVLLLLEHPPVLTLGRNANRANVLASDALLAARGLTLHQINRGGDVMWNWYDSFGWGWAPGIGGCSPWWFGGLGYYGPNIGQGYGGYRPPLRPHPPRSPLRGTGLIAVNRRVVPGPGSLPQRDKTSVVQIAGYTLQPMRSLSPRPAYDHSASGFVNGTVVTRVGGAPLTGQGRAAGPTFGASRPGNAAAPGTRSYAAPGSAPSASHSAPAASHASSGGGFSAGGGGGGGGGGGAAHAGGGGHH